GISNTRGPGWDQRNCSWCSWTTGAFVLSDALSAALSKVLSRFCINQGTRLVWSASMMSFRPPSFLRGFLLEIHAYYAQTFPLAWRFAFLNCCLFTGNASATLARRYPWPTNRR